MGKEISIPIATEEVFREGGKRFIVCQPQVCVSVQEAYAGNENLHKLETPIRALVGQLVWFPILHAGTAGDAYNKSTICGVFASEIDEAGKVLSKCPIAGVMMGDVEAGDVTIAPGSSATAKFAPQVGHANFKRFELQVKSGDSKQVFFSDFCVGSQSIFLSPNAIPFDVMTRDGAIMSKMSFVPGVLVSITMVNMGSDPVVIGGNLVFEEVDVAKSKDAPKALGVRN